jgi:methyl-accepting chemotaxis protein
MRFGLRRQLGVGIVAVLATIALLCFVLMSVLFSRTYDMLSSALAAKGRAEAASLAARVPFALTTKDQGEVRQILADFNAKDAAGRSVVILDKNLAEVASSGAAASRWSSLSDKIRSIRDATSWSLEDFVVSAAPSKNEDQLEGYVVTLSSLEEFLAVRSSLRNWAIVVFLIGVIVIAIVASLVVDRMLVAPIVSTGGRLRDIAHGEGDLTQRLNVSRNDEIGELAQQFNGFAEKLQGVIRDVAERSRPLTSEAEALTSASTSLRASVDHTIDRVSSVEHAAQSMRSNTATVVSAVDDAMHNLNSVATAVEEMTASIADIATSSEKASSMTRDGVVQAKEIDSFMGELSRSALAIDKVTETITSISAQTNLLALNATIEAARAGAAGKGFAVVANEIKELAQQTAAATEDVKERIKGIQSSTQSALAGNARIATVIGTINELVASIAAAINEQTRVAKETAGNIASASSGVTQANQLVSTEATVVESIAKDVAEVTAAANKISGVSEGLRQNADRLLNSSSGLQALVTKFKY